MKQRMQASLCNRYQIQESLYQAVGAGVST